MARIKVEDWLSDDGLRRLELFKRRGYTDKEIAKKIGIAERTFTKWKSENNAIIAALKKGKQSGIDQVEVTMFDKALGYTDQVGDYHPPDTVAGIFLLKNRRSSLYQDHPKTEEELESIRLDNQLKKYRVEEIERILSDTNPTVEKIQEFINVIKEDASRDDPDS